MLQALLMERRAFIELLVMNGFVMKNFLTVEKLAKLYNEAVSLSLSQTKAHLNQIGFFKSLVSFTLNNFKLIEQKQENYFFGLKYRFL